MVVCGIDLVSDGSFRLFAVWSSGGGGGSINDVSDTILVPVDGHCVGSSGSKEIVVRYTGANDSAVLQVTSNVSSGDLHKSAVIENLIIDGQNKSGVVGILLKNVYNCIVRNVTILNCEVGIKIENTGTYRSQSNHIEHVRMTNVKTGILFTAVAGNSGDFGFTTIKDVGIKLRENDPSNVGIQIGTPEGSVVKPYSTFIKASVWLGKTGENCGMKIYGELKYGLVMFIVECPDATNNQYTNKIGVDIQTNPTVISSNQSFMLTCGEKITKIKIAPPYFSGHDIVTEQL